MKELKVRLTFTEDVLGSASGDTEIHEEFIASKAPDALSREEEVEALGVEAVVAKGKTIFPRDIDGNPIMWDYQVKGFFKDACGVLKKVKGSESEKIKAYKKEIDGLIFPSPRKIKIAYDGDMGSCQRPLRAMTMQGERVALANSESINAGATMEFSILLMKDDLEKAVIEWLDYGKYRGLGQWRNSGKGRFVYTILATAE